MAYLGLPVPTLAAGAAAVVPKAGVVVVVPNAVEVPNALCVAAPNIVEVAVVAPKGLAGVAPKVGAAAAVAPKGDAAGVAAPNAGNENGWQVGRWEVGR
jgi:hypothetical protein